jgi:four helix bundle protein
MTDSIISLQDRTKKFAIRIIKVCTWLDGRSSICRTLGNQLLRSGTSVGANCQEAKSAQSRKDLIHKYEIALKEVRETKYWLEILIESGFVEEKKFNSLLQETEEITKILVTTVKKLKEPKF